MSLRKSTDNQDKPLVGHFINGSEFVGDGRTADVFNPADGTVSKRVALAGEDVYQAAARASAKAFPVWRSTPPQKRAQVMFRFKRLLEENSDHICELITNEHGKVLDDARGELTRGIEVVEYACGVSELLKGEFSKNAGPGIDSWSEFQPLGIVAGITPVSYTHLTLPTKRIV